MNAPPAAAPLKPWPLFRSFAGWRWRDLGPDAVAGLTLAAIAIPEQMATARLGGVPAADRLHRAAGRRGRLRRLRRFAADVGRRRFDHRADLRRRAGAAGDRRLAALRRRRGGAGARRRPRAGARRRARPRLRRRSAVDSGHDRLSRRHRRAHRRQPGAGAASASRRPAARSSPRSSRSPARSARPACRRSASACSCWR